MWVDNEFWLVFLPLALVRLRHEERVEAGVSNAHYTRGRLQTRRLRGEFEKPLEARRAWIKEHEKRWRA